MADTYADYAPADSTGASRPKNGLLPPSETDIFRFRYHHGVNLGSCFVLEKWLTPSMYIQGADSSELAAVTAAIAHGGAVQAQKTWEAHWGSFLSDSDLDWLANTAHCTSIRLPIGYFTLGPEFCEGTPFDGEIARVYVNAWTAVKTLITRAHSHGIGILIDFHAVPGGANPNDHSGTNSGKAELWSNGYPIDLSVKCLVFIAQEISDNKMANVIGLQLCNEASFDAPGLYPWYDRCITAISQVDASLPIYISDAWDLTRAVNYARTHDSLYNNQYNPVIVDTHCYWCFSADDKAKSPQQIVTVVPNKLVPALTAEGNVFNNGAVQVIIGEYSCVIDSESWHKANGAPGAALTKQFGQAQCQTYQQHAGGSYFWCLKMDWMPGGEWGFMEQTNKGNITAAPWLLLTKATIDARVATALDKRDKRRHDDITAHVKYWYDQSPSGHFEHQRYSQGWDAGFSDAKAFFVWRTGFGGTCAAGKVVSADKIGCLEVWIKVRMVQASLVGEKFAWEWEQGFRRGVGTFYEFVGV